MESGQVPGIAENTASVALCSNCCSYEQGIMCFREDEGLDSVLTLKSIPAPHTDLRL